LNVFRDDIPTCKYVGEPKIERVVKKRQRSREDRFQIVPKEKRRENKIASQIDFNIKAATRQSKKDAREQSFRLVIVNSSKSSSREKKRLGREGFNARRKKRGRKNEMSTPSWEKKM